MLLYIHEQKLHLYSTPPWNILICHLTQFEQLLAFSHCSQYNLLLYDLFYHGSIDHFLVEIMTKSTWNPLFFINQAHTSSELLLLIPWAQAFNHRLYFLFL